MTEETYQAVNAALQEAFETPLLFPATDAEIAAKHASYREICGNFGVTYDDWEYEYQSRLNRRRGDGSQWWVNSKARSTGHRSKMGPFTNAVAAATWAENNRPMKDWTVNITARRAK